MLLLFYDLLISASDTSKRMANIDPETTDAKTAQMSPFAPVGTRPRPCKVDLARYDLCLCFLGVPLWGISVSTASVILYVPIQMTHSPSLIPDLVGTYGTSRKH